MSAAPSTYTRVFPAILAAAAAASLFIPTAQGAAHSAFITEHCLDCHDSAVKKGGLDLEPILKSPVAENTEAWEKVVRRLRGRQMPPANRKNRPTDEQYVQTLTSLEADLASLAEARPHPGRTAALRRLTRTEYRNAIRDLLALEIDAEALLPADESSQGFDNITVGELSPSLLTRYITAAQKIARQALGSRQTPDGATFRIPADETQEAHVPGLPLGTRGGAVIPFDFPRDGEYELSIRLTRDRNEHVEGLHEPHQLEILIDRETVKAFTVKPPKNKRNHNDVDAHLKARIRVAAGPRQLGVTFVQKPFALIETKRQPYNSHFNYHRHPRQSPAIYQVSITGPFEAGNAGKSPSRDRIFGDVILGKNVRNKRDAKPILARLARLAWRRPVTDEDLARPLDFFRQGLKEGGFEAGIESALSAILVSPEFLFRIEKQPADAIPGEAYELTDLQLASRLSFFLWSSIPDEELLTTAEHGKLSDPKELEKQVRRMLADPRSASLVDNFADQWLRLRNLASITPNARLFPDFDNNLRRAFRRETELFFGSILREDRGVAELLRADYTYLNERLARHYGVPHVQGSRFRRVALRPEDHRGGLLRQGGILTATSYATRTSPVIRGNWVLVNVLGIQLPPPPPNVPELKKRTVEADLSFRERFAEHRANKACAVCHDLIDPVGFALENYDAVGRWRTHEEGAPVDVLGSLPDGSRFEGVAGLEERLLSRPEIFVGAFTEKLMTYALGRGVEHFDGPGLRKILADAKQDDYRMSSIILGIVNSVPFRMRAAL